MNPGIVTLIGFVLNFVLAYFIKKGAAPTIRKLIPILNLAVGLLTQIGAAMTQVAAPTGGTEPAVAVAGFFGTYGKGFLDIVINGLIQGLLTTGIHSAKKNVAEALKLAA